MKLTSRLNAAVEDLIKMGQKYKKRTDAVGKKIEQDRYSTIRNSDPSNPHEGNTLTEENEKRNKMPTMVHSATQEENTLTTVTL